MSRDELERLSKQELIELVLRLQRPHKTSRTSSKPPSTDPKQRRERSKPGGAKPGHKGHSRSLSETADRLIDHRPEHCPSCRAALASDLAGEVVSLHDYIELPQVKPVIERHRRLAVRCPACGARVAAALPPSVKGTPFGPRLHAVATYLKTFQALSYERLQGALADLFGLSISQGGLMNVLRRAQGRFQVGCAEAVAALRRAEVVASDETSMRIEGANAYHWVFRCQQAVVHHQCHLEGRLERGLVPAREGATGVRRLELRHPEGVGAGVVGVLRAVEADELVVELALEREVEGVEPRSDRCGRGEPELLGCGAVEAVRLSAEHGAFTLVEPDSVPGIGEKIEFVPGYSDATVFLHDWMYGIRDGHVETAWPLLARGKLQ